MLGLSLDAAGETYALLRLGTVTAIVMVTLNGRPVEQYQNLIGTNGSLRADYIGGFLGRLVGPGTGPGVLLTPYRRALHTMTGTTRGVTQADPRRVLSRPAHAGAPLLREHPGRHARRR